MADAISDAQQLVDDTVLQVRQTYSDALMQLMANGVSPTSQQGIDFNKLGAVYIQDWATRRAQWALKGQRDDGTAYSLERWVTEGQGYASDASYRAGLAYDSSTFARALATARDIPTHLVKDIKAGYEAVTSPTQWPWWLQATAAGLGLYYASQIWANFRGKK